MKNTLLIASAGAGKTTLIVKEALTRSESVLITTFTEENELEIRKKFSELNNGVIPAYVTIQTWFSFLIEHGVKPYQGKMIDIKINGLLLVNEKSGIKFKGNKFPIYYSEEEIGKHYFTDDFRIYSDKLSKFAVKCNEKSNGWVIERISELFQYVFIDEVQDMAGYDLEFIKILMKSNSVVKMAGDPRQVTYHTHFASKYKKYSNGNIQEFISRECKKIDCLVDTESLKDSWRNIQSICDFSNMLFPELPQSRSLQKKTTSHDGVFLVKEKDVDKYLEEFSATQLRYNRSTKKINLNYKVENFGESKGKTYDRVLIYPTKVMLEWILNSTEIKSFEIKCKLYVAITRARFSVAIVCKNDTESNTLPFYQYN